MGFAHAVFTALAAVILLIVIAIAVTLVLHLNEGQGMKCWFNFQCKSKVCSSKGFGLFQWPPFVPGAGTCQGGAPTVLTQPCSDGSTCPSGACATTRGVSSKYCCPMGPDGSPGDTQYCSWDASTLCKNLPAGQLCWPECPWACASGKCPTGAPGQPSTCL